VVVDRDARERRHRLALRSGAEAENVLRRIARHVGVANLHAGRNPQVAEALRDLGVLHHAAADEGHLAIELRGKVDEDLHPVDARRERRDDQLARGAREDLLERFDDLELGPGEAAAIDVRAVGKQREHAGGAELREAVHVEVLAVDRRLIDLEIARVDDDADRRVDRERDAVGHAVRHADELDRERADGDPLARPHGDQLPSVDAVLLELRLDQRQRQRRGIDRSRNVRQDVRHAADVVFVTVRQHERGGAVLLLQVRQVGDDPIDAEQFGIREHHPGVDDDRRLAPCQREHVHAELAEPAECDDFKHQ